VTGSGIGFLHGLNLLASFGTFTYPASPNHLPQAVVPMAGFLLWGDREK
jgi:hypothetical protein